MKTSYKVLDSQLRLVVSIYSKAYYEWDDTFVASRNPWMPHFPIDPSTILTVSQSTTPFPPSSDSSPMFHLPSSPSSPISYHTDHHHHPNVPTHTHPQHKTKKKTASTIIRKKKQYPKSNQDNDTGSEIPTQNSYTSTPPKPLTQSNPEPRILHISIQSPTSALHLPQRD